jgi:hypothetical protein
LKSKQNKRKNKFSILEDEIEKNEFDKKPQKKNK